MLAQFISHLLRKSSCTVVCLAALTSQASFAQTSNFLSIKGNTINIRTEPSTKSEIAWELIKGYPIEVVERKGEWLKVKDFEGTLGWVYRPLTSKAPHFLIKNETINLRAGPSTKDKVVTKLKKYDIVETISKKGDWAKVRTFEGQEGWILHSLAWGW